MEVNCEGCAGCCPDWRALAADLDHERRGPCEPIGDEYNLVALTRDEVRVFLDAGLGDALRPRLWHDGEREEGDGTADADGEGTPASESTDAPLADRVERDRGAPDTPG
jgi:hypothetical protein